MRRIVKAEYLVATMGSMTERGGQVVTASTGMEMQDHHVAKVGDMVRYPDGTETTIVSGAGFALAHAGVPVAIVGSELENGDRIIDSRQTRYCIDEYEDMPIPGLLQKGYVVPPEAEVQA